MLCAIFLGLKDVTKKSCFLETSYLVLNDASADFNLLNVLFVTLKVTSYYSCILDVLRLEDFYFLDVQLISLSSMLKDLFLLYMIFFGLKDSSNELYLSDMFELEDSLLLGTSFLRLKDMPNRSYFLDPSFLVLKDASMEYHLSDFLSLAITWFKKVVKCFSLANRTWIQGSMLIR